MPNKYYSRGVGRDEFMRLLHAADVSDTQFQMLTGRHRRMVEEFMNDDAKGTPTLSDLVILGTIAAHPEMFEEMIGIAKSYITGSSDDK